MYVIHVAMMYRSSTIMAIGDTRRMATSIHTRVTTRHLEQVSRTRCFQNGPDGVGGHSWIVNLQKVKLV